MRKKLSGKKPVSMKVYPVEINDIDEYIDSRDEDFDEDMEDVEIPASVSFIFEEDNDDEEDLSELSEDELFGKVNELSNKVSMLVSRLSKHVDEKEEEYKKAIDKKKRHNCERKSKDAAGEKIKIDVNNKEDFDKVTKYKDNMVKHTKLDKKICRYNAKIEELNRQKKEIEDEMNAFESTKMFKDNASVITKAVMKYMRIRGLL